MTNCPNCGGVIDLNANKCAFCDTPYYDLSCIPIHEPFILRLNIGTKKKPTIITQKVCMGNCCFIQEPICEPSRLIDGRVNFGGITNNATYEMRFVVLGPVKKEN